MCAEDLDRYVSKVCQLSSKNNFENEFIDNFVSRYTDDKYKIKFHEVILNAFKASFIKYDDNIIYLCISGDYSSYNDILWRIHNNAEGTAFQLLHEIGHYQAGHRGSKDIEQIKTRWDKLRNEHESEAWLWAFQFRKNFKEQYDELVRNFQTWLYQKAISGGVSFYNNWEIDKYYNVNNELNNSSANRFVEFIEK